MQLVRLMDNLLDILDRDPTFKFHFDGQVMPIMDYVEVLRERDILDSGNTEERARKRGGVKKLCCHIFLFFRKIWCFY